MGNSPRSPSAPANSSPVASSRTDIDISEGCVRTPSSAKSRRSVGYVRSLWTMKPVSIASGPTSWVSAWPPSRSSAS